MTVSVDYDGPSLSDTASLVSLDEFAGARARAQAELARAESVDGFGLPPEEDAVTVSSHDPVALGVGAGAGAGRPGVATAATGFVPDNFSLSGTDPEPDHASNTGPDPDVFQRLRLEDSSSTSLPTERGAQWLREQNAYALRTMLGVEPDPSVSEESVSVQHQPASDVDSRGGDLALERDERGNYYYTYTSEPSSSASLNGAFNQVVTDEPEQIAHTLAPSASQHGLAWLAAQQHTSAQQQQKQQNQIQQQQKHIQQQQQHQQQQHYQQQQRLLQRPSGSTRRPSPAPPALPPRRPAVNPADYPGIPPEVLQFITAGDGYVDTPERVTDCSACGVVLDSFRYVCSTCGERPSRPAQPESPKTVVGSGTGMGKGKARAESDPFGDEFAGTTHTYPPGRSISDDPPRRNGPASPRSPHGPHGHPSPHNINYPLYNNHTHPNFHRHGHSSPSPHGRMQIHGHPSSPAASSPSSSSSSGFEHGYELCVGCIEVAGVVHAAESASLSVAGSTSGSSMTLVGYPGAGGYNNGTWDSTYTRIVLY